MSWQPHTVTSHDVLEHGPVAALQKLFDDGTPAVGIGDALPPLWHWVALPQWTASSGLGPDGHPARGSFLPSVELPRRMFAGGEVVFHADLAVGTTLRRESEVVSVTPKTGRSGEMVVVAVATRLYDERGTLAIEERQDLVYRGAAEASPGSDDPPGLLAEAAAGVPAGSPFRRAGDWTWDLTTDPTVLMRFSAVTANAHRIHYDWPYATQVEGYPGLAVHGPLMTLALAELFRLEQHSTRIVRMTHRNHRPLFCGQPARLRRTEESVSGATVALFGQDDTRPCTTLTIEVESAEKGPDHA
jgi:3-methylfumaryl-CoA hydratase